MTCLSTFYTYNILINPYECVLQLFFMNDWSFTCTQMLVWYLGHMLISCLCFRSDLSTGMQERRQLCGSWNLQLSRGMDRWSLPHRCVTTQINEQGCSDGLEVHFWCGFTINTLLNWLVCRVYSKVKMKSYTSLSVCSCV